MKFNRLLSLLFAAGLVISCSGNKTQIIVSEAIHPEWSKDAVIYEVNTRQFTPEGTFSAFAKHLPRLHELGVEILWFMPVHPIGEVDRKGTLGSYYSIKDYKAVNPEFGTFEDFKMVVDEAHKLGIKVIIDWVANHTSRDAVWTVDHPEWYVIDTVTNKPIAPFDWTDVAKLDYSKTDMREAMAEAMLFWVKEAGIDGFRCDVAAEVPVDFWESTVTRLREVQPELFMLAEGETPELQHKAFNMYYSWTFHHIMNNMAQGKSNIDSLRSYLSKGMSRFPLNTVSMNFTSNHDENSWNGTEFERLGNHAKQMAALTFVMPGMPLIYNGQEAGFNRRLQFFEKDSISWSGDKSFEELYKKLILMKKENRALDVPFTQMPEEIKTERPDAVLVLKRVLNDNIVLSAFNFSAESVKVSLNEGVENGNYKVFNETVTTTLQNGSEIEIEPFGFKIFYK
ncbi:MAG: alpha-amylase [Bacteroidetes bacterium HGW-Bacteroidetes-14]|mgnify:FL=1|jgi:glycosidase|nr:MAG: alpha-amylase [Bacteroidetes bacterium HGW-Bacteroidetes-14]